MENHIFHFLDTTTTYLIYLWLKTAISFYLHLGINQWDFGPLKLENAPKNSSDQIKKSTLVLFLMILDKYSLVDLTTNYLYGILKETWRLNLIKIIKMLYPELDSHQVLKMITMYLLVGMEEWKFGTNSLNLLPHSKLTKILFMLLPLTKLEVT